MQFDVLCLLTALQVTEPCALIPVVLGAKQLTLVGDHKQLGPCVSALGQEHGLDISLFDRLLQSGLPSHMLNVQYRMHPDIAKWPSENFYAGRLLNGPNTMHLQGMSWQDKQQLHGSQGLRCNSCKA